MVSDTKPCPFCGKLIKQAAIYCRLCRHNLPADASDLAARGETEEPVTEWEVTMLIASLVDKSLVVYDGSAERYRLLESAREYAADRLQNVRQAAATRGRHMGWCLGLGEEAQEALQGPDQAIWLDRLEAE